MWVRVEERSPGRRGEPAENTQHGVKTMAVRVPFPMVHGCRLVEGTNLGWVFTKFSSGSEVLGKHVGLFFLLTYRKRD